MNTAPRNPNGSASGQGIDEREWQLQERALHDERAAIGNDDPALARYRQVARALRQPLPPALPMDFAERVAARAGTLRAPLDTRVEQAMTTTLMLLLALAGIVAVVMYGGSWLRETLALLPPQTMGFATSWGLALAACVGLSWSLERLHTRITMHSHA